MTGVGQMYGVVLWADKTKDRAVIWCEDHGDLAFFHGDSSDGDRPNAMTAGDLIQFDVNEDHDMRTATHPRVVLQKSFPTLTGALKKAGQKSRPEAPRMVVASRSAHLPKAADGMDNSVRFTSARALLGEMPDACGIEGAEHGHDMRSGCDVIPIHSARRATREAEVA